jgi:glycosyltransferase involved in cell wall biosynthesis
MNILMLHNRYLVRGGEDESTDQEAALLRHYGHTVDLFEVNNTSVARQGLLKTGLDATWSREFYNAVNRRLDEANFDLVHVQNFFPLFSPSVLYAARSRHIPVVQALRNYRLICLNGTFFRDGHICEDCMGRRVPWPGVRYRCYRDSRAGSLAVAGMLTVHRLLGTWTRQVDVFYTLSEFARAKLVEGGLPGSKIIIKPNFVYPDPGPGERSRECMLMVSRLAEGKGILSALEAWERLDGTIPLKIVGDGPLLEQVRQRARSLPQVEVLGRQDLAATYDWIGKARAVLFPTEWYETFGRVVIEAFAKGTPVLVSNLGSAGALIEPGVTGLHFSPGDPADLSAKVKWAWEHPHELEKMGQNARKEYEEKYTAEKNYQMLFALYQRAIAGNRASW